MARRAEARVYILADSTGFHSTLRKAAWSAMSFQAKLQAIGAEDLIDLMPIPRRDQLKANARKMQEQKAALIQAHPELLEHAAGKKK